MSFDGDAASPNGIQRITYRKGKQTGYVTVIVLANTVYVRGDTFALVNYMGFMEAAASKYENVWIVIPHTDSAYSTVAAGVNLSSTMDELKITGRLLSVPNSVIHGQPVFGVRGIQSSSGHTTVSTLYARRAGEPLPVEEVASQDGLRYRATFSRWNESIELTAPRKPVPVSVVRMGPAA